MKYLKRELYEKLNNNGTKEDEEEWVIANESYMEAFKCSKQKLPQAFVNIYENNFGFHDANIERINILFNNRETTIQLLMDGVGYYGEKYTVLLKEVRNFEADFMNIDTPLGGIKEFNYSEILLAENKHISWEIDLFNSTMRVEFKKIEIESNN